MHLPLFSSRTVLILLFYIQTLFLFLCGCVWLWFCGCMVWGRDLTCPPLPPSKGTGSERCDLSNPKPHSCKMPLFHLQCSQEVPIWAAMVLNLAAHRCHLGSFKRITTCPDQLNLEMEPRDQYSLLPQEVLPCTGCTPQMYPFQKAVAWMSNRV